MMSLRFKKKKAKDRRKANEIKVWKDPSIFLEIAKAVIYARLK
jgi:hypothetical protein